MTWGESGMEGDGLHLHHPANSTVTAMEARHEDYGNKWGGSLGVSEERVHRKGLQFFTAVTIFISLVSRHMTKTGKQQSKPVNYSPVFVYKTN